MRTHLIAGLSLLALGAGAGAALADTPPDTALLTPPGATRSR